MGHVCADEGFPVGQALLRYLFFWPRFPLASVFLDNDRLTVHPPTSLSLSGLLLRALSPHLRVNKLLGGNSREPPQARLLRIPLPRTPVNKEKWRVRAGAP